MCLDPLQRSLTQSRNISAFLPTTKTNRLLLSYVALLGSLSFIVLSRFCLSVKTSSTTGGESCAARKVYLMDQSIYPAIENYSLTIHQRGSRVTSSPLAHKVRFKDQWLGLCRGDSPKALLRGCSVSLLHPNVRCQLHT